MSRTMNESQVMAIVEDSVRSVLDISWTIDAEDATDEMREQFVKNFVREIRGIEFGEKERHIMKLVPIQERE